MPDEIFPAEGTETEASAEPAHEVHAEPAEHAEPVEHSETEPVEPTEVEPVQHTEIEPVEHTEVEPVEHVDVEPVTAAAEPAGETAPAADKNWYIIHTYSGFEQKVADSLRSRAEAFGFSKQIGQILIPTEEVIELRGGKKVTSKRLLYPGYVMVEMEMNDQLWHEVKNTPRVTGFVGGGNTPVPLTADEVNQILYRQATSADRPRPKLTFEKNETVRINEGPFANFSGKIDEVNLERNTVRVLVTIFGRATPVELDFLQVEKI
jgi:transcription termination/antitermination protein NusG